MNVSTTEKLRVNANSSGPHVKYLVRRETHSSRAIVSTVLALLLIIGLVYLAVEGILALAKQPKLLVRPQEMWQGITQIASQNAQIVVTIIGIILILLGLFFWAKAFFPGRLGRHSIADSRVAYIVDDGVIASDISRKIRQQANLPAGQVTTNVSNRKIQVEIVPTSGNLVDRPKISEHLKNTVAGFDLQPNPHTQVHVSKQGKVAK